MRVPRSPGGQGGRRARYHTCDELLPRDLTVTPCQIKSRTAPLLKKAKPAYKGTHTMLYSASLTMLPSSFAELQNTFSTHKNTVYVAIGTSIVFIGLNYARKVNRIQDGEPPLLPGALPIFGHALAFLRNSNKVYETAR